MGSMTEKEEKIYWDGYEMACEKIAAQCLGSLRRWSQIDKARLILERQESIRILRDVCAEHGDNDWPDDMYLPDIIEKHLYKHLGQ